MRLRICAKAGAMRRMCGFVLDCSEDSRLNDKLGLEARRVMVDSADDVCVGRPTRCNAMQQLDSLSIFTRSEAQPKSSFVKRVLSF